MIRFAQLPCLVLLVALGGCSAPDTTAAKSHSDATAGTPPPSNRIAVPRSVRANLGISFATATYRPVADTVWVPGHFTLKAHAQHHYPLPFAGRVRVHVHALDVVEPGQLLLEIDAPEWRRLQSELADTLSQQRELGAQYAAASAARDAARTISEQTRTYDERLAAIEAQQDSAQSRFTHLLGNAASITGITVDALQAETEDGVARWRSLDAIPVRATAHGTVQDIASSDGSWVEAGVEVLHIVDSRGLRFHGQALQADVLDDIRDGQPVRIVPPDGDERSRLPAIGGQLRLGVTGEARRRTIDLYVNIPNPPEWARPQLAALAGVVVAGDTHDEVLAIPLRAVIDDGTTRVFFRRDPKNPDAVIKVELDAGVNDGRWIEVRSGIGVGDEVVVDGIYQLALALAQRQGGAPQAGHFHADGTFHSDSHDEEK